MRSAGGGPAVAYLTGCYPRATDTFIQREVAAHREAGWRVETFAVRRPADADLASDEQREERERTDYLLERGGPLLADAARAVAARPRGAWSAVMLAWRTRRPGLRGTLRQVAYLVEGAALARRLRARGIHHLHDHLGDSSATVAMLSAELGRHTWSFTLHGPGVFFEAVSWQLGEKVRRASFCACISYFARAQAAVFAPDRLDGIEIVHCGVDPTAYPVRAHDGTGRQVVSVGRLDVVKGYTVLLDAVAAMVAGGADVVLTLVGDGPDRAALERQADRLGLGARVTFPGARSPAEVVDELAGADVFVLPSFAEGVPVSLMEAMASGLPVVATRVGGVAELVDDGRSGLLVAPGDGDGLARAVGALLADASARTDMGRAGRARVEEGFDSRREASRLRDLFVGRGGVGTGGVAQRTPRNRRRDR